jgi:methionyl-tRNA formyltransferase
MICHSTEPLNRLALPAWLASFTDLAGIVVVEEPRSRLWKRVKREVERIGWLRFFDVLLFRLYYRLLLARADNLQEAHLLRRIRAKYPVSIEGVPVLQAASPNSPECEQFVRELKPDMILARCKFILNKRIFSMARIGTFVMHPGICPEYRNAHGCFWALANRDLGNVGMTLLKIDEGVDTGPVYGYYRCDYDELRESHILIQDRVVFDNLDTLEAKFREIMAGTATTEDTTGRKSAVWGQPWLSRYLAWKRAASQRSRKMR